MALKDDILKAFETNLTHSEVNQDGEPVEKKPIGKGTPLDTLATDLSTAIAKYIKNLSFRIEDLKAEGTIMPGVIQTVGSPAAQANVNPVLVKVLTSKLKNEVGLPQTQTNAKASLVKVDKDENRKLSGVNV